MLTAHPHLTPTLKKEYSYTATPLPGPRGLLQAEICLLKLFRTKTIVQVPVKILPQLHLQ